MSNTLRQTPDGKVYFKDRSHVEHLLNPSTLSETSRSTFSTSDTSSNSKFKLVTVRNLKNKNETERKTLLEQSRARIAEIALRTGKSPPYPEKIPLNMDELKVYGVYVDEDLYPGQPPIYTFTSNAQSIKAFINATGVDKDSWYVHLCYSLDEAVTIDFITTYTWHIITLHGDGSFYFISNEDIHPSYKNVSIDYINYLGGGTWQGFSLDLDDRYEVHGLSNDPVNYKSIGTSFRYAGVSSSMSVINYSFTPSYSFTWNRGVLKLTYRDKEASKNLDIEKLVDSGVIEQTHKYAYSLDLYRHPAATAHREFVDGTIVYVGNTNEPEIGSNTIFPDYGTDLARLSVASYTQTSNIIRSDRRNPLGVLCSNALGSHYLYIDVGVLSGAINHGYDVKTADAERGFQYGEDYKLWWVPGKVIGFQLLNDGRIYRISKTTGVEIPTTETLFDRGQLLISKSFANATETTWNALPNPQTGFFGFTVGSLKWRITYLNPPILGHQGVYYYEISPNIATNDATPKISISQEDINNKNTLLNVFAQIQGGLGGTTTINSYYLGYRSANLNALDSIVVRDPTPSQKAVQRTNSHIFPAGFWPFDFFDIKINNTNDVKTVIYSRAGEVTT